VLGILFLVSLFFPKEGIRINDEITLQFLTLDEIFGGDSIQYADISSILYNSQAINDSAYFAMLETGSDPGSESADETTDESTHELNQETLVPRDTLRANAESLKTHIHPIEYPGDDNTLLYPFFRKMRRLKQTHNTLRIMHYGDSQIEGDRITSFIRFKLQEKFGGSGIGMQPTVQLYGYQLSIRHTASDDWQRYTAFGNVDSTLGHNRFGALGCFTRFSPYPDPLSKYAIEKEATTEEAWITLEQSMRAYRISRNFQTCRLYYGNTTEPVYFEVWSDGELHDADYLEVSNGLQEKSWKFDKTPKKLNLQFKSACSPDFYGISLDHEWGLSVDNVPLRGSSGLVFSKMDAALLKQMYKDLNVKLLLLQFGGNVVPYISKKSDYYEKWFYRELKTIKSLVPDMSIIVIGVADMSVKQKDNFVTYSSLESVRDALRNAAFKADCAFWDMYAAMGGENSMPSWVFANPPLASADFVHFNERGARVLGEMFYNAFIYDYNTYIKSR